MHFILTDSAVTDDIKLDQRRPLHICNFLQDFLRRFRSLGEQDHYDPPQLSFSHNNNDDEKYIEKKGKVNGWFKYLLRSHIFFNSQDAYRNTRSLDQ